MRELELIIGRYDRVRPIETGEVTVDGVDLSIVHDRPGDIFLDVAGGGTADPLELTEMSLSTFTLWTARGDCPYVGIPVFPSRFFRHGMLFVNGDAGIDEPVDLHGKNVGIFTEYQMTMATTLRGALSDDYGVDPEQITWYTDRVEKMPLDLPDVSITVLEDGDLHAMLERGDLDALMTTRIPPGFGGTVHRLFPDFKAVERDYYERTGVFPIMHTIVIHEDLHREDRTIVPAIYDAMVAAKEVTVGTLYDAGIHKVMLPWMLDHFEEARAALGEDFWPYGMEANQNALEALTRWSYEQGLSQRRVEPAELFVEDLQST